MNQYRITDGSDLNLNDIIIQLKAIKELPCTIRIYDRVFIVSNKEELNVLVHGVEIGWYMCEEHDENNKAKDKNFPHPEGFTGRVVQLER